MLAETLNQPCLERRLAMGLPLLLLVLATWLQRRHHSHLPRWLQDISRQNVYFWNVAAALSIVVGPIDMCWSTRTTGRTAQLGWGA